jgi:hypothetical protein
VAHLNFHIHKIQLTKTAIMGRPRKPTAILELNGAFKRNPARGRARANEPKPDPDLGLPPGRLTKNEKAAWYEIVSNAPRGVLAKSDRLLIEGCARILAKWWKDGSGGRYGVSVGEQSLLWQGLSKMGFTPSDRSKVTVPPEEKATDPFAEIAQETKSTRPN